MLRKLGLLMISMSAPLLAQEQPLPARTDIPEDYSAVVCPGDAAAIAMLRDHHRESPYGNLDTPEFMRGLAATGCEQDGGPLEIERVIQRRAIGTGQDGPFIAFEARRPNGEIVFGTVDEGGNNAHPRTPLERWAQIHAPGGMLEAQAGEQRAYLCPSTSAAQGVIAAIPPTREPGVEDPRQSQAFASSIRTQRCVEASGRFRVTEVHASAFISLGFEAGEDWTALTAIDVNGNTVGLVYDASLM